MKLLIVGIAVAALLLIGLAVGVQDSSSEIRELSDWTEDFSDFEIKWPEFEGFGEWPGPIVDHEQWIHTHEGWVRVPPGQPDYSGIIFD